MMNTRKWRGAGALRSLVAIITMAAVLVLTLPVFKLDAGAVVYPFTHIIENGTLILDMDTGEPISNGSSIPQGSVLAVSAGLVRNNAISIEGLTSDSVDPQDFGEVWVYLYSFPSAMTFSVSGSTITFSPVNSSSGTNTNTDSGSATASSPVSPPAAGQPMDSATIARLWSEFNAWLAARDQEIRAGQEAAKIRKDQQAQLDRDNLYFRNIAEFNRNGIHMFVNPDHSVIPSTIPGLYWANNVPGFAAQAIDPTQAGNLLIETWNINASKAPKSWGVIMQVATDNGYTVGATFQANIGEKGPDNKPVYTSTNKAPVANLIFGVPESIQREGAQFGAIGVLPGGEIHIYNALPFENGHVTLGLPIGEHAIGVVRTN